MAKLRRNLPGDEANTALLGGLFEVSLNLGPEGAIKPYVRYDRIDLPEDAGPYLGLRSNETEITRVYVADTTMGIGGVAWIQRRAGA